MSGEEAALRDARVGASSNAVPRRARQTSMSGEEAALRQAHPTDHGDAVPRRARQTSMSGEEAAPSPSPSVVVEGLSLRIPTMSRGRPALVHAASEVDLSLAPGRLHALVGESGAGKSVLCSALVGLLPAGTRVRGRVQVAGVDVTRDVARPRARVWERLRGRVVGLVSQSAATSFTPTRTIGSQLREVAALTTGNAAPASGASPRARRTPTPSTRQGATGPTPLTGPTEPIDVVELLASVGLGADVLDAYPHELSGGMAARAGVAAALTGRPSILLADEPTAGLDPELTATMLRLLRAQADAGVTVLLVTHEVGALLDSGVADDISVVYAGRIVENGPAARVLGVPQHAYTEALLAALPRNGLHSVPGSPPSLTDLAPATSFADRLTLADGAVMGVTR